MPGPIRAPDSKTMLILSLAIRALCHAPKRKARLIFQKVDWLHDSDLAHCVVDDGARGGEGGLSAAAFNRDTSLRDLGLI